MIRILWVIFFNLILAILLVTIDCYLWSKWVFLTNFFTNQLLPISATILWFNLSGIIFLLGQISWMEMAGKSFSNSKNEIKHNIIFMGIAFLVMIFLLIPYNYLKDISMNLGVVFSVYQIIIATIFFMQIFASYEIVMAVFRLKPNK